jgi:uncharacterized protein YacL
MEESRDDWTWRDTLARLQHIDRIIETIVTRAIALNVGLLAAFFSIAELSSGDSKWLLLFSVIVAVLAIIINRILARQLARQDCIHKFYLNTLDAEQKLQYILPKIYRREFNKGSDKEVGESCLKGFEIHYCEG